MSSPENNEMNTTNSPTESTSREHRDAPQIIGSFATQAVDGEEMEPTAENDFGLTVPEPDNSAALSIVSPTNPPSQDRLRTNDLPSRAHFVDPSNGLLLPLTDSRTHARPRDICCICLDPMDDLSEAEVIVSCNHIYHRVCLRKWFENEAVSYGTCPLDRSRLFVAPLGHSTLAAQRRRLIGQVGFQPSPLGRIPRSSPVDNRPFPMRHPEGSTQRSSESPEVSSSHPTSSGRISGRGESYAVTIAQIRRESFALHDERLTLVSNMGAYDGNEGHAAALDRLRHFNAEIAVGNARLAGMNRQHVSELQASHLAASLDENASIHSPQPRHSVQLRAYMRRVASTAANSSGNETVTEAGPAQTGETVALIRAIQERDLAIADRDQAIEDRNRAIRDRDRARQGRDLAIQTANRDRNRYRAQQQRRRAEHDRELSNPQHMEHDLVTHHYNRILATGSSTPPPLSDPDLEHLTLLEAAVFAELRDEADAAARDIAPVRRARTADEALTPPSRTLRSYAGPFATPGPLPALTPRTPLVAGVGVAADRPMLRDNHARARAQVSLQQLENHVSTLLAGLEAGADAQDPDEAERNWG
ncbi:hypothetical protein PMIN04_005326 [Paraphaeosphaeria minitans]